MTKINKFCIDILIKRRLFCDNYNETEEVILLINKCKSPHKNQENLIEPFVIFFHYILLGVL